jgi:hypothetical protein
MKPLHGWVDQHLYLVLGAHTAVMLAVLGSIVVVAP